ncbi:SDR family oxidoreductase [Mesorhizobium sp.]|uniref:SDR family oxidoreductase n=1 Tax=Mesorhizobium sp. TaxID=1871066 RepID=UPI000FE8787D|nr:SDR family oxidoreductase [Mesorhizobium sp.]RWE79566.1 MAG: SDR family oxidoreductase [Mesorhizobium sp.]
MSDTIAFITGGNRGIGLETARQLAKLGVLPVIGSRNLKSGGDAVAALASEGLTAEAIEFDVLSAAHHQDAFDYFSNRFGRLDVLINNAGIHREGTPGGEPPYTASTTPLDIIRETMEANFFSTVAITDKLLPLVRKSAAGRIVNLSTILASLTLMADPSSPIYSMKSLAYDTSKVAINSYTIQLARELSGTPIKVNSAHPGWVQTEMGGPNAMIDVVEGAKTSVQLATLGSDGATGGFFHLGQPLPW